MWWRVSIVIVVLAVICYEFFNGWQFFETAKNANFSSIWAAVTNWVDAFYAKYVQPQSSFEKWVFKDNWFVFCYCSSHDCEAGACTNSYKCSFCLGPLVVMTMGGLVFFLASVWRDGLLLVIFFYSLLVVRRNDLHDNPDGFASRALLATWIVALLLFALRNISPLRRLVLK